MFRHRAGNYYAVVKVLGKIRRQSLDTDDYNLAKHRLGAALAALRGATEEGKTAGSIRSAIPAGANRGDAALKKTPRHHSPQVAESLLRTSDTLAARPADNALVRAILVDLRGWLDPTRRAEKSDPL